jgi:hypothetical protein
LGFVRAKKQRRDQTRESLRGDQKYKSRNECGFESEGSLSVRTVRVKRDLVQGLAFGLSVTLADFGRLVTEPPDFPTLAKPAWP